MFIVPAGIGIALALTGWRDHGTANRRQEPARNPLQFTAALQMAALFQIVLFVVGFVTARFGQAGIYPSAAVLGLADMDALTISMAQLTTAGTAAATTATAVAIGIISNTIVKLVIVLTVGTRRLSNPDGDRLGAHGSGAGGRDLLALKGSRSSKRSTGSKGADPKPQDSSRQPALSREL